MLPAPLLDRRGAPGGLVGLPFDRLSGFAPGLGFGIPRVLFSEDPRVGAVRNLLGSQIAPSFEHRLAVERPLPTEDRLDFL